jgi:glucose-6-phosphate 1-epimerase
MQTAAQITELNRRFEIASVAEIVEGQGGLAKVAITCPTATAEMYLHGAQVTSWKPAGAEEVLFLSSRSQWQEGHAIRGGVPICFPWFRAKSDDPTAPTHGFVRTKAWRLESIVQRDGAVSVSMITESDANTKRWWPADFRLILRATFGSELRLELELTNTGVTAVRFEEALHSYFKVGQVQASRLHGLDKVQYLDNTDSNREKVQQGDVVLAAETDRAYLTRQPQAQLEDPTLRRGLHIAKENSSTTVVWNPWAEGARALADLGDDEWTQMFCVEASNVLSGTVDVKPGQQHRLAVNIRVADAPIVTP